jgi:hypothetical protein
MSDQIKRGFYRHYKGDVYRVLGIGMLYPNGPRIVAYRSRNSLADDWRSVELRLESEWLECVDGFGHTVDSAHVGAVRRFTRITGKSAA